MNGAPSVQVCDEKQGMSRSSAGPNPREEFPKFCCFSFSETHHGLTTHFRFPTFFPAKVKTGLDHG